MNNQSDNKNRTYSGSRSPAQGSSRADRSGSVYSKNQNGVIEIDLIKVLKTLWQHALSIMLAAVIAGGLAFSYTYYLVDPTYEANCEVYVNNSSISIGSSSVSISSGDLTASKSLVDTYIVILQSRTTLNEVIKKANLNYSYTELLKMISASSVNNTEVFNIVVTSTNPDEAKLIANTIARVLPEQVSNIVDGSSVRIVDYAVKPTVKSGPSITKNTAIGFIAGFAVMCCYIVLLDLLDDVIHDEDSLAENVNLPILGVIPDLNEKATKSYYYSSKKKSRGYKDYDYKYKKSGEAAGSQGEPEFSSEEEKKQYREMRRMLFSNMSFAASEAYKLLRTNINFIDSENDCKIIGISSATRGEGKSTTALNLAYTLAETGKYVLLIDADLRIPTISKRLGIEQSPGLSAVLAGLTPLNDAIVPSKIFEKWHIIPAGAVPPNPNELLGLARTKKMFETFSESYDYVIVDLPPVNIVADALTIAGVLDGMIIVARQDYSSLVEIRDMLGRFDLIGILPLGFVLTDVADRSKGYKYSKYRKYGSYRYKKDRYQSYGYSSYSDKRSYSDPRLYSLKVKPGDSKTDAENNTEAQTEKKGLL